MLEKWSLSWDEFVDACMLAGTERLGLGKLKQSTQVLLDLPLPEPQHLSASTAVTATLQL